jgi:hypothetical protein
VKRQSQNAQILELLSGGQWVGHHRLYEIGCVAHSRIAELRTRGYVIEQLTLKPAKLVCVKCGSRDIGTSYHKRAYSPNGCTYLSVNTQTGEHLHHFCQNCHYDWTADVLVAG